MGTGAKRDRISEMPEEIKEQIISSLCMKDAVCTSSLSSVWRYTWVSLPFIDFGYDFFLKFTSFFSTLPATHPKRRHLYSIIHDEEDYSEWTVDDTVDDSDFDSDYDTDDEYNDWITKHAWQFNKVGCLQTIDEFLQLYIEKNPSFRVLKKMSLYLPSLSDSKMRDYGAHVVSRCLSLAKHNVDELIYWNSDIGGLHCHKDSYHALQNCLTFLEFKTLTKLKLHGCYLAIEKKVDVSIDLPNLKQLCLISFNTDENMLEALLAKCRALEKLELSLCKGFRVLRVPRRSKLKMLQVKNIYDLDLVKINAVTLQCLTLVKLKRNKCKVKMASNSCNNLVKLFVSGCGITDAFFNNVAEFPHLETVYLVDCPKLKHIKITGNSLTHFEITECPNLSQLELDTPKRPFIRCSYSIVKNIKLLHSKCGVRRTSSF